ncbi:MAG: N-acetylglucosamine-6-phosphate deacetylase [Ignavibacteriae bacterium]|nr:N-acetylglucosamine-6-phosphate deacetylase [Ignavibacteriota bacterium]NOG96672.1 N-acetylglucosamine-6-phosphate deacetylase [Ignavibacteriota bacterium]
MVQQTVIKNCYLYSDSKKQKLSNILIEDGIIKSIDSTNENINDDRAVQIDAENKVVIPGLIDVHIQGAGGADILDNGEEALITISKTLAETGTTSYLGTTVVKPEEDNRHLRLAESYFNKKVMGAELIGIHLEGPFINPIKKGGLNPAGIYEAGMHGGLEGILDAAGDSLKMMTIAPELEGNEKIIKDLREKNIIAAFAHSDADYEQTKLGFKMGINHVTHLYNAMRTMTHREPGPIPAIFEEENIPVQIISDGHHINGAMVNLAYRNIGIDRCICITDGMHGIGLPEGKYLYNGREYISKDGAAKYLDGTLIGSTMSLLNIALKFMQFTNCSFEDAINSVTINPAKLLGLDDKKGNIKTGADADLVILNEDYTVDKTIVHGEVVYSK